MATSLSTSSYAPLLLRLALGLMWLAHGSMKLSVFTVAGFAGWLEQQGLPGWAAGPVIAVEIIGGIAIVLGLFGRWISLALVPVLAVALWTHVPNGWLFTNAGGGWEFPAFLIAASLVHALLGDGDWALRRPKLATA
ncbi:MAG: DoxX family protein [Pseudomonadota bacterium]